ncbi:hypothetical protein [Streptomyces sp. CAU 1734]|uniref:hypothetical protein n=1 Tax=Streptomyces sp. CAU 1734 TaxID=3140360 RepID=UPI0032614CF2
MAARRRIALTLATAALIVPVTVGCSTVEDAVNKAVDCVETVEAIGTSVTKLGEAAGSAAEDPTKALEALDSIDKELTSLGDKTDNADLDKAAADLNASVDSVRKSIESGAAPDIQPVKDAAAEMGKICSP